MSRGLPRPRRSWGLVPLSLLTAVVSLALTSGSTPASADAANDPLAAVTYQLNPAHDGSYVDPTFVDPLRRSWSVDLGGSSGYPVIADGRVFVTIADDAGGEDVEALSLATGDVLWGPKSISGTYRTGMLAYDGGQVFTVNFDGRLTAFDAATGTLNWVTQLPGQYAFSSPPTAAGGSVYVGGAGSGGTLYSVDEATGDVSWAVGVMNGDNSSPAVGDDGVFVSYACEQAYKFGLDGSLAWHYATGCEGGGGNTPVLHDGDVYIRDNFSMSPAVLDASTGELVGSFASDTPPAFDGSHMATESGGFLAMWDTTTGTRLWKSTTSDNVTAPLFANGYVVEGRSDGTVELRNEQNGSLIWSGSAGAPIAGTSEYGVGSPVTPAVGDGALVVPAGDRLTTFVPSGDPYVSITGGPAAGGLAGPHVSFSFTSNVPGAEYTCTIDGTTGPCTSPVTYRGLAAGSHAFSVSLAGTTVGTATRQFTVDDIAPRVRLSGFHPILTRHATVTAHWSETDANGVANYQLRLKRTVRGTPMPRWTYRAVTTAPSVTMSQTLHLRRNTRLCVAVRAQDVVGNWSEWTTAQCVVRER